MTDKPKRYRIIVTVADDLFSAIDRARGLASKQAYLEDLLRRSMQTIGELPAATRPREAP